MKSFFTCLRQANYWLLLIPQAWFACKHIISSKKHGCDKLPRSILRWLFSEQRFLNQNVKSSQKVILPLFNIFIFSFCPLTHLEYRACRFCVFSPSTININIFLLSACCCLERRRSLLKAKLFEACQFLEIARAVQTRKFVFPFRLKAKRFSWSVLFSYDLVNWW